MPKYSQFSSRNKFWIFICKLVVLFTSKPITAMIISYLAQISPEKWSLPQNTVNFLFSISERLRSRRNQGTGELNIKFLQVKFPRFSGLKKEGSDKVSIQRLKCPKSMPQEQRGTKLNLMKTEHLNYLNGCRHKPFQSLFEIRPLPYTLKRERERQKRLWRCYGFQKNNQTCKKTSKRWRVMYTNKMIILIVTLVQTMTYH